MWDFNPPTSMELALNADNPPEVAPPIYSWDPPASIEDLLSRLNAPATWTSFFKGELIDTDAELQFRRDISEGNLTIPHGVVKPLRLARKEVLRIFQNVEKSKAHYNWITDDPYLLIAKTEQELGLALAERAVFDVKLKALNNLLEQDNRNLLVIHRFNCDQELLMDLVSAIRGQMDLPDDHRRFLSVRHLELIDQRRALKELEAAAASAETAEVLRLETEKAEERNHQRIEALKDAPIDRLLHEAFGFSGSPIATAFKNMSVGMAELSEILQLQADTDPVRHFALDRLKQIGAATLAAKAGVSAPTDDDILEWRRKQGEEAEAERIRLQEEAERAAARRLIDMETWDRRRLAQELEDLGVIAPPWTMALRSASSWSQVDNVRGYLHSIASKTTDDLHSKLLRLALDKCVSTDRPVN